MPTVSSAIAAFGAKAKQKLGNPVVSGEPEDQLRAPFEQLLADMAELVNIPRTKVAAVGESSLSELKTRPDYAITVHRALVGFVELKAPGKGADPRKFRDPHDKAQWEKLRSLPNVLYSDGNAFSLWQNGQLVDAVITLLGDIESSGDKLAAPPGLLALFENFLRWEPIPPRNPRNLVHISARHKPSARHDNSLHGKNGVFLNHCRWILHHEFHLKSRRSDALAGSFQSLPTWAKATLFSKGA